MKVEEIHLALKKNQEVSIEFGALQDIEALFSKAEIQVKEARDMQKILKSNYSQALIRLESNIPAQVDNAIKKANELGADDMVIKLNALKKKAMDLASTVKPIYSSI